MNREPVSHFFYSNRLKLQLWDYGQDGKPAVVLVHGGLDHARMWDWVARSLREDYHVYAFRTRPLHFDIENAVAPVGEDYDNDVEIFPRHGP